MKKRNVARVCQALACVAAAASGAAHAQAPAAPETTAKSSELAEIVVTAQRRSELQRDVPIAITTVSANQLQTAAATNLADITQLVPTLRFDYNGPWAQPTIRGIGTSLVTSGGGANVGIYVDGFYSPNPLAANFQLLNVENIQVLKGPQGTLFGRNTTGGAILVTTAKPSHTPSVTAEVSYGAYNTQRYQGYVTTGIGDKLAVDFAVIDQQGDGFQKNVPGGLKNPGAYNDYTVRTGVEFDPTDGMSFLFRYEHQYTNDPTTIMANAYTNNGRTYDILAGTPGVTVPTAPGQVAVPRNTAFHSISDIFQLTSTFDLGFARLTSYTQSRVDSSLDIQPQEYSVTPILTIHVPVVDHTTTQEFLLNSEGQERLTWTTGLFFFDYEDLFAGDQISLSDGPLINFGSSDTVSRSYATYANVTYEAITHLYLTVGLRISRDQVSDAYFVNDLSPPFGKTTFPSLTSNIVTPRLSIRYGLNDFSNVYFTYAQGYKAPLINVSSFELGDNYVSSEKISSYEVGYEWHSDKPQREGWGGVRC